LQFSYCFRSEYIDNSFFWFTVYQHGGNVLVLL
jgi:hypothetical protein